MKIIITKPLLMVLILSSKLMMAGKYYVHGWWCMLSKKKMILIYLSWHCNSMTHQTFSLNLYQTWSCEFEPYIDDILELGA